MTTKACAGMEELTLRVQAALNLVTKKEADCLVNVFVSCLEDTLIEHLAEDGYSIKLNGFEKFIVHHRPARLRKIGFSGETREIPPRRKVKFVGSSRVTERIFLRLVAKNRQKRHYIQEAFCWRRRRPELSVHLLVGGSVAAPVERGVRHGIGHLVTRQRQTGGR